MGKIYTLHRGTKRGKAIALGYCTSIKKLFDMISKIAESDGKELKFGYDGLQKKLYRTRDNDPFFVTGDVNLIVTKMSKLDDLDLNVLT